MAEGKVKNCADCLHNAVCSIWRENECQDASLYYENGECFYGWTSVKDEMPPEHDSIFKKLKGTKKWLDGMFETISDTVIVSVKFEDGTRKTFPAHTADGKWRKLPEIRNHKVTHWMPMPGPKED